MERWAPANWGATVAVAALVAAVHVPVAQAIDPRVQWYTLTAPHFEIHYEAGRYQDALDIAYACEAAYEELSDRLAWEPSGATQIVVMDEADYIQGIAVNLPLRRVYLHTVAPEDTSALNDFDDFRYLLVTHELTHTFHIDTIGGLPAAFNTVFGNVLSPNGAQPGWVVEGFAVYMETAVSGRGRAMSPFTDMVLRAAALEGALPELDLISGETWRWPQGAVKYYYGGYFIDFLARRFGEDTLRKISHDYGARIVPWAVNLSVERATGYDYPALWADFATELKTRFMRQRGRVEHRGRIEGERLTHRGQEIGAPRIAKDGTIYFIEAPIGSHAVLKAIAGGSEREVAWVYGDGQLSLTPNGRFAIVAQMESFEVYRYYKDLFRIDLETGTREQLTEGARARGPDVAPDGERIVFVQNDGGHSVVRLARLDALAGAKTIIDLGPRGNVWTPRFAPGGHTVVCAGSVGPVRDLWAVDLDDDGKAIEGPRRLTSDQAIEGGPVFTPDGRYLLYHSDRDGIFNLYALPVAGGEPRRVTRVLGGAFHPEPTRDGTAVVYRTYGHLGFDLARIEVPDWDALPLAEPEPLTDFARLAPREPPPSAARASVATYPVEEFRPWSTLIPRAWLPATAVDTRGSTIGVGVAGGDILGQHSYSLDLQWGIESERLSFRAYYANQQFHPGFWLRLSRSLVWGPMAFLRNGARQYVEEDVWTGQAGVSVPIWNTRDWSLRCTASYEMTVRHSLVPFLFSVEDTGVVFPDEGRFASVRLSVTAANAHGYIGSISAEDGGRATLAVRLEHPYLGSEFAAISATLNGSYFLENPLVDRHVLAVTARVGYGVSSYERRKLFAVAGPPQRDLVLDLLNGRFGTGGDLRGFPQQPFYGDLVLNGSVEYRLPIFDIEASYHTLPLFFRTLSGALFFDAATIADDFEGLIWGHHFSLGAELRLELLLGFAVPLTVRFGWGHGLGDDGNVDNWYLGFGESF